MALKLLPEDLSDVPAHLADRYEAQAGRYWDLFYRRNTNKFFKDRHYLHKEFPDLAAGPATLLEVGCGVGNTVFPLLDTNPQLRIYCCDFAASAIELVRQNPLYGASGGAVQAFVADITADPLAVPSAEGGCGVPAGSCDLATMIFVLSAIHPQRMAAAVHNVAACLRPGTGRLLFRDYADGDLAQERLAGGDRPKRLGPNFYVRGDGTRCYYFNQAEVLALFASAGFHCDSLLLHERTVVNHKRDIAMDRRWLQAIFTLRQPRPPPLPLRALLAQPPPRHNAVIHYPPEPWQLPDSGPQPATPTQTRQPEHLQWPQTRGPEQQDGGPGDGPSGMDLDGEEEAEPEAEEGRQAGCGGPGAGMPGVLADAVVSPGRVPGRAATGAEAAEASCPAAAAAAAAAGVESPLPGLMLSGGWLTGAAGRLASHLAAGPGHHSGRALLPDSLDDADDMRAELSPSPNHPNQLHHQQQNHPNHPNHNQSPRPQPLFPEYPSGPHPHLHHSLHEPYSQQHPYLHKQQQQQQQASHQLQPQPQQQQAGVAGSAGDGSAAGEAGGPCQAEDGVDGEDGMVLDGITVEVVEEGGGEEGGGEGCRQAQGGALGRSLESQLEAEFFATIGRNSEEVAAEEVAAAGAALSRVRLADVAEVAAARLAAAAAAAASPSSAAAASIAAVAAGVQRHQQQQPQTHPTAQQQQHYHHHHQNHSYQQQNHQNQNQNSHNYQSQVPHQPQGLGQGAGEAREVEVTLAKGVSFRCMCGHVGAAGQPPVPPATLALAHILLASPGLLSGKCAIQLGPAQHHQHHHHHHTAAAAAVVPAAVLPAMAAVRGSARRVVVSEAGREGLAAAAADLRRNAPLLVIERLRLAALDWVAAGAAAAAAAAAAAVTGSAGYTYVSGGVRQLRDILQMQPTGFDVVYGADPLAEVTKAAVAMASGETASVAGAGEAAIAAARGLFEVASQLIGPAGGAAAAAAAARSNGGEAGRTSGGRLLLLSFPGEWAAAHGMGFAAVAAVCGWELLVPEQLTELYGIDAAAAAAAAAVGCAVMGFRRKAQ